MSEPFIPRTLVNGSMLRQFTNKDVSIMLRVVDETDSYLTGMSTDSQEIRVQLPNNESLGARKGNWVEIIGVPSGATGLQANDAILFSEEDIDFDTESYNMMVNFINNAKDIYRTG